jgi:hypothetical protein
MATALGRALAAWAIPVLGAKEGRREELRAVPVGVIEISDQQTRFVPITDRKKLTGAVLAGIGFGMWLGGANGAEAAASRICFLPAAQ